MNREEFFGEKVLHAGFSEEDIKRVKNAYWLAKRIHEKQERDDGERYFEHCRETALILFEYGNPNADEIITALLHDAIEDGFAPPDIIKSLFGEDIENAVLTLSKTIPAFNEMGTLTERTKKPIEEYFCEIASGDVSVKKIKLADRLHNLCNIAIGQNEKWDRKKIQKYLDETRKHILPIAQNTNERFAEEIEKECKRLETEVGDP